MPMEFTLARRRNGELAEVSGDVQVMHGASPPHQGTVILSEFVSSARVMRGALTVNPWRIEEVKSLKLLWVLHVTLATLS